MGRLYLRDCEVSLNRRAVTRSKNSLAFDPRLEEDGVLQEERAVPCSHTFLGDLLANTRARLIFIFPTMMDSCIGIRPKTCTQEA